MTDDLDAFEKRLDQLEDTLRLTRGMVEGQHIRIDRMLGTLDDLLKRFEAWKQIGNEMGELVKTLQDREQVNEKMWEHQSEANAMVQAFMDETRTMLENAVKELQGFTKH
jgi:hypothetical protein